MKYEKMGKVGTVPVIILRKTKSLNQRIYASTFVVRHIKISKLFIIIKE